MNSVMKNGIVFITGGASGLGKEIALEFGRKSYTVYCTSRKEEISDFKNIHFLKMDITSDTDVQVAISKIVANEGRIDVIVNNAGITLSGPTLDFSTEDFKTILDTNVIGHFRIFKEIFKCSQKPKMVINITSLNGYFSFPNFGIYCASKFAAEALGLALHYELSPETQVVNVSPGALAAESQKKMPHKSAREKIKILNWLMPLTSQKDVARKVEELVRMKRVPSRVRIGRDAHIIHMMQKILPDFIFDRMVFFIWKKR